MTPRAQPCFRRDDTMTRSHGGSPAAVGVTTRSATSGPSSVSRASCSFKTRAFIALSDQDMVDSGEEGVADGIVEPGRTRAQTARHHQIHRDPPLGRQEQEGEDRKPGEANHQVTAIDLGLVHVLDRAVDPNARVGVGVLEKSGNTDGGAGKEERQTREECRRVHGHVKRQTAPQPVGHDGTAHREQPRGDRRQCLHRSDSIRDGSADCATMRRA